MITITKQHTFAKGPRQGQSTLLTPHKFGDGQYKVFSPDGVIGHDGKRHWNRLGNSKSVKTLDEVATYVRQNWGVRMSGPLMSSPSICWKAIEVNP
jgi:hypothetical protein